MVDQQPDARDIVEDDRRGVPASGAAVHLNDRHGIAYLDQGGTGVLIGDGDDRDGIDAAVGEAAKMSRLGLHVVAGVGDEEIGAAIARLACEGLGQGDEVRIGEGRDHDADGAGLPRPQGARGQVRSVADAAGDRPDPFGEHRVDLAGRSGEHPRGGRPGHARGLGHVDETDALPVHRVLLSSTDGSRGYRKNPAPTPGVDEKSDVGHHGEIDYRENDLPDWSRRCDRRSPSWAR